tara:strand:+ start:61 stop:1254 length:1194 start_codon:yes stop_codon:yes gene_type:complete
MANTNLTIDQITNEALMILHQKANFLGTINRQYDDSYAKSGAKIGDTLRIRLPNQYTVRTGAALNTQDITETNTSLQVSTQKGVDVNFTSEELTMDIDAFSDRILKPAMSVLVANIEADAMNVYKDVYNQSSNVGSSFTMAKALAGGKILTDNLAPYSDRCLNMSTQPNVDLVDALKGLFNAQDKLSSNYKEGRMAGPFAGFDDIYENTLWPSFTSGTDDGTGDHLVNGADQSGSSITHSSNGSGTFVVGDIITFAGCNSVHPETKADTGALKQFVVTAAMSGTATTVSISPSIVLTGATQNVSAAPTTTGAITKVGGASAVTDLSMGYHKDAFTFATADLIMPQGVDMASRKNMDGVSLRIVRDYDINNDRFPCRVDVLYGYKAIRPELAVRYANN